MAKLKAPMFPESIVDGILAQWHKQEGDLVKEGDIIVEIETDKIVLEVPATTNGILENIKKKEGDVVFSEEEIAAINTSICNSKQDMQSQMQPSNVEAKPGIEQSENSKDLHLTPSARKTFNASGLDSVVSIEGTGKKGRIMSKDVEKVAEISKSTTSLQQSARFEKRIKMTRLRKTIANRLLEVQHTNAILTTFNEVDMSLIIDLRKKYKDLFVKEHNIKLGFMSFFIKATIEALKKFPDVNASIDGDDIIYHNYFDMSIAVGTDRGVVVPVLKDVDTKSLADLELELIDKARKAKNGKLSIDDMKGGTFTITNGGTYGSMLSTPIINPPQSAILGMHNIVERAMVINGEIKIRPIMYLALSYDHRIIDGSTSVKFLKSIKEFIEDPSRILLQI